MALKFLNLYFEFHIIDYKCNYIESKYDNKFNELKQELYNKDITLRKCQEHNNIQNTKIQKLELEIKNINMNYDNITNSFTDIINDLQDQINKLKMQINNNSDVVIYDYEEIKQKNKALNAEFKRVAKLMKLC
jgi:chromosome segregation ATPase